MTDKYIDIVIYLAQDWKTYRKSALGYFVRVHLIKALSKIRGVRILCVNRPITPVMTALRKPVKILELIRNRRMICKVGDNIFLYTPFSAVHDIIASYIPFFEKINRTLLRFQLRRVLRKLGFSSQQLCSWISHPFQYSYLGLADEKLKVYEVRDAYSSSIHLNKMQRGKVAYYEEKVLKQADVVFAVSENLYAEKAKLHKKVYFIPQGVEFGLFVTALEKDLPIPDDLKVVPKPRIVFVGAISGLLDFKLLNHLAKGNQDWSLVFIGHIDGERVLRKNQDFIEVFGRNNVYFLGRKEYSLLPRYLKHIDVALLPYNAELDWIKNANSQKTYQYLASGKPIVSTDVPWVRPFSQVIKIARNNNEFSEKIREAISETSPQHIQQRIDIARNNSWAKRAEEVSTLLNKRLSDGK